MNKIITHFNAQYRIYYNTLEFNETDLTAIGDCMSAHALSIWC